MRNFIKTYECLSFRGEAPQCSYTLEGWREAGFDLTLSAYGDKLPDEVLTVQSAYNCSGGRFSEEVYIPGLIPLKVLADTCYTYYVFKTTPGTRYQHNGMTECAGNDIVIAVRHGGGTEWLVVNQFGIVKSMEAMLAALDTPTAFILIGALFTAAKDGKRAGHADERKAWATAYYEGRIQKKRRNGTVTVSIESPFETRLRLEKKAKRAKAA